jgi:uncharacterized membrane protein (UPF0127 family)
MNTERSEPGMKSKLICRMILTALILNMTSLGQAEMKTVPITLGTTTIHALVADTDETRIRGLLGHQSLSDQEGMLLDFILPGEYAIHMQGMRFPIDAVWIDAPGKVVLTYENIAPNGGRIYPSMFSVRYCLELNAGFCRRFNVRIGDRVSFTGN